MKIIRQLAFVGLTVLFASNAMAEELKIEVFSVTDGKSMGFINAVDTNEGILLTPNFQGLSTGLHGMHIHENPSCGNHANDAGGHWDPKKTKQHLGPYQYGHLGDLPALYVNVDNTATLPVLAPHLLVSDLLLTAA